MPENNENQAQGFDQRPAPRQRVLLTGLIVFGYGAFTWDCTFRNLSSKGARIAVKQLVDLPDHFHVINIREGVAYRSRVIWKQGLEVGTAIENVIALKGDCDYLTDRLKKLWLAKAPR